MKNTEIAIIKSTPRWQDWLALIIGIWVFITPWIFGFNNTYFTWSPFVSGALVIIFSLWAIGNKKIAPEWINLIIGIWIFISPWVLGFAHTANAAWNMFLFGAIMIVLPLWSMGVNKSPNHESIHVSNLSL